MKERTVLIVDDEPEIIQGLTMRLKANGYRVVSAMDGLKAAMIALEERPDVIILDIGMPVIDGHTVAQKLKANAETRMIPIVFLTARTAVSDVIKGAEAGVVRYLTKPFEPETLLQVIDELTRKTDSAPNSIKEQGEV